MMREEKDEEFMYFLYKNWQESINQVKLRLYKPRLNHKKISISDLFELQQKCSIVKKFSLEKIQNHDEQTVLLCFDCVQDALDFQLELKQDLTYSMSLIEQKNVQTIQNHTKISYQPLKLQQQIEQEGFQIQNGLLKLKKVTSVEQLIKTNIYNEEMQQSTYVHTERKMSIDYQIQQNIEQEHKEHQNNCQNIQEKKNQSIFKPLFDGILVTGAVYGGFRLLKYFIKF